MKRIIIALNQPWARTSAIQINE